MNSDDLKRPLVVDLDGTLLKVDSMDEAMRWLLLRKPLRLIWYMIAKLSMGRAPFKWALYGEVEMGVLPFNTELVEWLKGQKAAGRKLVLASATPQFYVEKIGKRLGDLFDEFIGSTPTVNRRSKKKAAVLVEKWGEKGFDYMGNSAADVAVWRHAHTAYNVNPSKALAAKLKLRKRLPELVAVAPHESDKIVAFVKSMRLSHWAKNLLIVVPMLAAHRWENGGAWLSLLGLFVALGLVASAGYLWNDFVDLEADRENPSKKNRPMASGDLSVMAGWNLGWILMLAGFVVAFGISPLVGVGVGIYFIASVFYTFHLKTFLAVDMVMLAGLYVYRMVLGGWVSETVASPWLVMAAFFFFVQLAALKRACELRLKGEGPRRPYKKEHQGALEQLSITAACLGPVVVAIYAAQPSVAKLYTHPAWLVLTVPVLLYWGLRCHFRMMVGKGVDPLRYATQEVANYLLAAVLVGVILLAR